MEIFVRCDSCQKSLAVDSANEGKKARCPVCGSIFEIRTHTTTSVAPQSSPGHSDPNFHSAPGPAPHPAPSSYPKANVHNDTFGWVSISLGIIAIFSSAFTCCCPLTGVVSLAAGIAGIVTGVFALDQTMKIVGMITSGIGIAMGVGLTALRFLPLFLN